MEHIFLTRKSWSRFGGVPGLCLTLQEIGVPKLNLHGPPGIDDIFASTKKFVVLRNMSVVTPDCKEGGFYEDSVLRVNYVPIFKSGVEEPVEVAPVEKAPLNDWSDEQKEQKEQPDDEPKKPETIFKDDTDYFGYENNNNNRNIKMEPTKSTEKMESVPKIEDSVMAFICKLQPRAGALDFAKCVDAGVQPGPLLGRLKNGYDVTLPSGAVVKADDVRGPASPGSVFIFVDIPDESYLPSLTDCKAFDPHTKEAAKEDDVALVVIHFCNEDMMENATYKAWMEKFSPSTKHLFVNERNEFTGYFASHRIQRQLNELDENVFPMLKEPHPYLDKVIASEFGVDKLEEHPAKKFKVDTEGSMVDDKFKDFPELGMLSAFHIRPPKGFDRSLEPYSNPEKVLEETLQVPNLNELIAEFKKEAKLLTAPRSKEERAKEFPKVITFGTGSCIPNKTRNVSANLIHIADDNCALLDCGEGTLGQIVRFYGRDGADDVLKKLRLIYISHLHADHHLGLLNILNRRRKVTDEKVLILAPIQITAWLAFYNFRIEEIFSTFDLFACADLVSVNSDKFWDGLKSACGGFFEFFFC